MTKENTQLSVDTSTVPDDGDTAGSKPAASYRPAVDGRKKAVAPRGLCRAFSLEDIEEVAKLFLPKPVFGYIAGASETGRSFRDNRSDFSRIGFVPRVLGGHTDRGMKTSIFGVEYDRPFGISPMGLSALAAYDGDIALAKAAASRGTFAIMSATSLTSLERVSEEAGSRWFQAYFPGDTERVNAMTDRIAAAGYGTLVVTVDVAVNGNRETDLRNNFGTPLALTPSLAWQCVTHPRWLFGTALRTLGKLGMPHFENLDVNQGPPILARNLVRSFSGREQLNWEHLKAARDRWKGNLVLKGILSPEDTEIARGMGCDGIIVSNHGGRQLDGAITPLAALPAVLAEAGQMTIMLDSGVRRGTDVMKALAMGASFVFVGRPMLLAAAVSGEDGVRYAIDLLTKEINLNMAHLSLKDISQMSDALISLPDDLR